jgi:hypothetical protein
MKKGLRFIHIKHYETICRSRWGWHLFRETKQSRGAGRIVGFRILGLGLAWS